MKKQDFMGKYILRDGDLKPEEITVSIWKKYSMTVDYCLYLDGKGLLFDSREDAERAYTNIASALKLGLQR